MWRRSVRLWQAAGCAVAVVICIVSSGGWATTYFVAPSGDNAAEGNEAAPWRTIQHALDRAMAGDTVMVAEGTYAEHLETVRSGTAEAPIVVCAQPDARVILTGVSVDAGTGVTMTHDYHQWVGIEVCDWASNGFWIEGAGHWVIRDCDIHDLPYGIGAAAGAHDFLIERVDLYAFDLYGFDASPSGGAPCLNGVLRDCSAHSARDPQQNVDGFALGHGDQTGFRLERCSAYGVYDGFDLSARSTQVEACTAYNNGNGGFKIWADDVRLENCVAYGNQISNVELDWDGAPGVVTLRNCTFYGAGTFTVWVENAGDRLDMKNCILAGGSNIGLAFEQAGRPDYVGDYNLFQNENPERAIVVGYEDEFTLDDIATGAWTAYGAQDAHSRTATAPGEIFLDPEGADFRLTDGSPAVDAASLDEFALADFAGVSRPQGGRADMGAYEQDAGNPA